LKSHHLGLWGQKMPTPTRHQRLKHRNKKMQSVTKYFSDSLPPSIGTTAPNLSPIDVTIASHQPSHRRHNQRNAAVIKKHRLHIKLLQQRYQSRLSSIPPNRTLCP
jgi:hypothetical protein